MLQQYKKYLLLLKDTQKYRNLQTYLPLDNVENKCFQQDVDIILPNNSNINFSTNDYLGLSRNEEILQAGMVAGKQYGIGATGSRLLSGNNSLFMELEHNIAKGKGTQAALFFSCGYLANLSTLSALLNGQVLQQKPLVLFDRLNHASLYQASVLAHVQLVRYKHGDINDLKQQIKQHHCGQPTFIVTESIFGMDGDIVSLQEIADIALQYQALLYIDEAHATGVLGEDGYGLSSCLRKKTVSDLKALPENCVVMGTFSKALGVSGGYIACNKLIKEYLVNKANGFIYSTAPSPVVAGMALQAWKLIPSLQSKRDYLKDISAFLRQKLIDLGFNIGNSQSHIIPIIIGKEDATLKAKSYLQQQGILTSAVRPPTVPPNSSRLRIALTADHSYEDLHYLISSLKSWKDKIKL